MQADLFLKPTPPLVLTVGGPIPSFKNNKMVIAKSPQGRPLERPLLITKPEYQNRMEEIIQGFERQLLSAFQADKGQTLTASSLQLWMRSCVPADDCWEMLPEIVIKGELCESGKEGAIVIIERI